MMPPALTSLELEALAQFAHLEIRLEDLVERLDGKLTVRIEPWRREVSCTFSLPDPGVRIELSHIQNALQRESRGLLRERELGDWAAMILMIDAYDWSGSLDEDRIAEELNELALLPAERNMIAVIDYKASARKVLL